MYGPSTEYLAFISLAGYGYSVDVHDAQFFLDERSTLHYIILAYLLMKSPWYILLVHSLKFSFSEPNTHPHPPFGLYSFHQLTFLAIPCKYLLGPDILTKARGCLPQPVDILL